MEQGALFVFIIFGLLLLLVFWGVPIGVCLCVVAALGMFLARGQFPPIVHLLTYTFSELVLQYAWVVMPLFILMGVLAAETGVAADFFTAANKLVCRLRGGMGIAVCYACAALGAVTGSTISATMIMGKVAMPELKKFNYQSTFALGIIASAATVAILIPPSIMLVIYGILAEQSIGKLLVAGVIPGIAEVSIYSLYIWGRARLQPSIAPPGQRYSLKEGLIAQKDILPLFAVMLSIIFGILLGFWTAVEAAAVGTVVVFGIGVVRRRMTKSALQNAAKETVLTTGSLMILIIGSLTFSKFLAVTGVTPMIIEGVVGLNLQPVVFFMILLGFFLILGCFIEGVAMMALTIPVLMPIVLQLGWDPIWFGIIFVRAVEIAAITPPVGLNLYALKSVLPEEDFLSIAWGCFPFWILDLGMTMLLYFVPQIALWLPNMMM